jgi:hypothetical protein
MQQAMMMTAASTLGLVNMSIPSAGGSLDLHCPDHQVGGVPCEVVASQ